MVKKIKGVRGVGNVDKDIGLRIRAMRTDQGISQGDLGIRLGVSFQQIQKYEKGTNRISAARLMQIAEILTTTPHELMGWERAVKINNWEFDLESYKLAKSFASLQDNLKAPIRSLINTLISQTQ